jgi:antibiotic biosynthesis monooxygenase (ABM) superfamily enzyme
MTVYRKGIFARALGRSRSDNPYARGSDNRYYWREGWSLIDDLDIDRAPEGWDEWFDEGRVSTKQRPNWESIKMNFIDSDIYRRVLSLTLANFERAHRLRWTRNIGSFSTIS